jgi:hypothetical protein
MSRREGRGTLQNPVTFYILAGNDMCLRPSLPSRSLSSLPRRDTAAVGSGRTLHQEILATRRSIIQSIQKLVKNNM